MSAAWYVLSLAVAFAAGWFLCSYYEAQARIEQRRNARIVRAAQRDGRVAQ